MAVVKTASPTAKPSAATDSARKTVPSSSARKPLTAPPRLPRRSVRARTHRTTPSRRGRRPRARRRSQAARRARRDTRTAPDGSSRRVREPPGGDGGPHLAFHGLAEQPGIDRARAEVALGDAVARPEVEQDEVRLRADGDAWLVKTVRACRAAGHSLQHGLERYDAWLDEPRVQRCEGGLEHGHAEGGRLERHVLLVPRVRRVIGGNRRDRPVL